MTDVAFLDRTGDWINLAYISVICLALVALVVIAVVSHHRSAARAFELRRLKEESEQKLAAATVRIARANQAAAAAEGAASQAKAAAAAAELAQEQLKKENLELEVELERERKTRQEAEERIARLNASEAITERQPCVPRVLAGEQAAALTAGMRKFSGKRVTLVQLSDSEAGALAEQLRQTLEDAHWDVIVSRVGGLVPPQRGVILTHASEDAAASELVAALRSFGLIVYERMEPVRQLEMIVGLRPPV